MNFIRKYWSTDNNCTENVEQSDVFLCIPGKPAICFICKLTLPKVNQERLEVLKEDHMIQEYHVRHEQTMKSNSMVLDNTSKTWKIYCRICSKTVDESVINHVDTFDHKAWFVEMENLIISDLLFVKRSSIITIKDFLTCKSKFAHCQLCNINIECTSRGVRDHIWTESHRKELLTALKPNTGIFPVDNNTMMWCKICDLRFDNNVEKVLMHLSKMHNHGEWTKDINLMKHKDISLKEFFRDVNEMKAMCHRCDLKIKCDPRSIEAHVHSEAHRCRFKNNPPMKSLAQIFTDLKTGELR